MPVEVGKMCMYINIALFCVDKLTEEWTKDGNNMNSLVMPTWGVKSNVVGGHAMMAYPLSH